MELEYVVEYCIEMTGNAFQRGASVKSTTKFPFSYIRNLSIS